MIWEWPEEDFLATEMDPEQQDIFNILVSLFDSLKDKTILEPGSGTGRIGFHLHGLGSNITLLDSSCCAVRGSSLKFKNKDRVSILNGNLLKLPFKSDSFDLVWNSGVMEHFHEDELLKGLAEMARVSKRFIAVFVPNKMCLPYNVAKLLSEADGRWKWGLERPKVSLRKEFDIAQIDVIDEFEFAPCAQNILSYLELLPENIAEQFKTDFTRRNHFYNGMSLATIGVKRKLVNGR